MNGQDKEPAAELVRAIAEAIVDEPSEVSVDAVERDRHCRIELTVDPADLGKMIGKKGRTAKSIRTVLGAMGAKTGRRYALEILEDREEAAGTGADRP